jgi:hypothetical protein
LKIIFKMLIQISSEVLKLPGPVEFQLEPLPDGFNFMSDAFFVDIKNVKEVKNLFVKASCIAEYNFPCFCIFADSTREW